MQERVLPYLIMNHLNGWASCDTLLIGVADSKQKEFGRVDALPPLRGRKCKVFTQDL